MQKLLFTLMTSAKLGFNVKFGLKMLNFIGGAVFEGSEYLVISEDICNKLLMI